MKNITLSADEALIKRAQARARAGNTTLSAEFRRWLQEYTAQPTPEKPRSRRAAQRNTSTFTRIVLGLKAFEKTLEKKL